MTGQTNRTRGTVCALLGAISWGVSGTFGQYLFANRGISANWLTTVRMLAAGLVLLTATLLTQRKELRGLFSHPRDRVMLAVFGVCGLMVSQYTYLTAVQYTNAGTATVLQYAGPVLIMAVTCVLTRKLPRPGEVVSILFILVGVALLATHGNPATLVISPKGLTWGLLAAVGFLLYTMLPTGLMRRWGNLAVTGSGMVIGGVALMLLVRFWRYSVPLDRVTVGMTAVVVLLGTVISYTLYLQGVRDIGPVRSSMISCVEPVTATVCSTVWMHTAFAPVDLLGFAIILSTVFLLNLPELRKKGSFELGK